MSIEQKFYEVNIFQLQTMSNAISYIDQRFAFTNSRISGLALVFNLSNQSPVGLDTVGCQFELYRWSPCGVTWDDVPEQSW